MKEGFVPLVSEDKMRHHVPNYRFQICPLARA